MSSTEAAAPAAEHHTGDVVAARDLTKVYGEGESEVRALDGVTISSSTRPTRRARARRSRAG